VKLQHAEPLGEALKILDKENKSDFVVDRLYSQYHYSHPTLAERLRAIQKASSKVL
jgi:STE24 endopeptidase